MRKPLQKEIRFAAIGTALLDVLLWLCSLPLTGIGIAVPLGLAIGSAGMLLNLLLLRRSILRAVNGGNSRDFGGYLLRCVIACAVMASGMMLECVSALAVILPFLYPKLLFGILSMKPQKKTD